MGLFNLFKRKSAVVAKGKRTPLIKRPPVIAAVNGKKVRVKNYGSVEDRGSHAEFEDDGYDYALDANGEFDFDRDGDGYPGDPGDGGAGGGSDDMDDDDIDAAGFDDDDDDDDDE